MAQGQYLGKRGKFIYKDDSETSWLLVLDETLGSIAELGLEAANKTNAAGVVQLPPTIKPRYVNWQGVCDGEIVRKRLVCNRDSLAFDADSSTSFEISGSTEGGTTSRIGERQTFLRLPEATA